MDFCIFGVVLDGHPALPGNADGTSAQIVVLRQQRPVSSGHATESQLLPPGGLPAPAVESALAEVLIDAFHYRTADFDWQFTVLEPDQLVQFLSYDFSMSGTGIVYRFI